MFANVTKVKSETKGRKTKEKHIYEKGFDIVNNCVL